jgi:hypothetical protein
LNPSRALLEEPGVSDPQHYARRVLWLAMVHPSLFASCVVGLVLLIWRGQFFVTLSQRSNVETLTLAFLLLFFAYFAVLTFRGALGALRVLWFRIRRRVGRSVDAVEAKKQAALGRTGNGSSAALDKRIELEGRPDAAWELDVRDAAGSVGRIRVDGLRIDHVDAFRGGSNTLLAYVAGRLSKLSGTDVTIVHWKSTDEESLLQYATAAEALHQLGRKLDATVWPTIRISDATRASLERELAELCPALRDEAFLPDWEFQGEHKLPIIPEPLGIISLSRSERRVDPLSSLTAALIIVCAVVGVIAFFLVRPPWVPSR